MRLITFETEGKPGLGVEESNGRIRPYELTPDRAAAGVLALVQAQGPVPRLADASLEPADLKLRAAFPRPLRNIFCVGKNYHEHAKEFARSGFDSSAAAGAVPKAPIIFSKVPECVTGPGAAIEIDPAVSTAIDYEAELLVVIGRWGRGISKADALDHVWGYSIVNDVTARDLQGLHSQWLIGKSQDTFCPMASTAVTANEIDLADTRVRCWVNDELRQDANTSQLIFDVPTLIATLSAGITLLPGDLIATGTPAGVGIGFNPPRYLKTGDRVAIEISGIGRLENSVTTRPA
jgi:2-keto-4-pentenoate hydratase/2-oxohepta-3-ene-1,7-dioic acid hydratase in catechol pathway